jgi:hypothetical protein
MITKLLGCTFWKSTHIGLMEQLIKSIHDLGWSLAIPNCDKEEYVPGLIIGTEAYVSAVIDHLPAHPFWKRDHEAI